jgi:putrescine aminotransferase
MTRFWHPVADMHAVATAGELVLDHAEGTHVWDEDGNRYVDAVAGLWYCNVGYGRERIVEAAADQMRRLAAYSNYGDLTTRSTTELADRIVAVAPMSDASVFFTSGGGESIETAVKMVRRYWSLLEEPERTIVISRERAYHGLAGYGTSIVGTDAFTVGVGPLAGDTLRVPWDDAAALASVIDEVGAERVAAFFCEPIIGAGGVFLPPEGYLGAVREICRDRGILFLADEVICGFGRIGDWFASTRFELEPDLVTFAKAVTSGYVPLGGVIVAPHVRNAFWAEGVGPWRHGYTYSGHAVATAAAHPNLDIIEEEGLLGRARELESDLAGALAPLAGHSLVSEVRAGLGVVAGVQLDPSAIAADPTLPDRVALAARDHGVLTRVLVGGALQVSPALVIDADGLAEIAAGLAAGLDDVATLG